MSIFGDPGMIDRDQDAVLAANDPGLIVRSRVRKVGESDVSKSRQKSDVLRCRVDVEASVETGWDDRV